MTVKSKTFLIGMNATYRGGPFCPISVSTVNSTDFNYRGNPYFGVSNDESITYEWEQPVNYRSAPHTQLAGKSTINAGNFNFAYRTQPYWVEYTEPPPSGFDASRFFMIF